MPKKDLENWKQKMFWQRENNNERNPEKPAPNGRFGAMSALAPRKRQCELGSFVPVREAVEAPPSQSRWDVICHLWTVRLAKEIYDKSKQNYRKLKKSEN